MAFSFSNLIKPFLPSPTPTSSFEDYIKRLEANRITSPTSPTSTIDPRFQTAIQSIQQEFVSPTFTPTAPVGTFVKAPTAPTTTTPTAPAAPAPTPQTFTTPSGAVVDAQGNLISEPPTVPGAPTTTSMPTATMQMPSIAIPQLNPETEEAVRTAEKAVQLAMQITPGELQTQADLDRLLESSILGLNKIREQPIPMPFITGQAAALQRSALAQAQPLEQKLARLQAERLGALTASQFGLERAEARLQREQDKITKAEELARATRTDIFNIGLALAKKGATQEQLQRLRMAQTREDALIIAAETGLLTEQEKVQLQTLGPGEILVDSKGNIIARGGPREPTAAETEKAATKAEALATATQSKIQTVDLLNNILADEAGIRLASGLFRTGIGNRTVTGQLKTLASQLSLTEREKLRGSGTISDFEARMLASSVSPIIANMDTETGIIKMSENAVIQELKNVRGVLNLSVSGLANVSVTNLQTGETRNAPNATREEINSWIQKGYIIDFQ